MLRSSMSARLLSLLRTALVFFVVLMPITLGVLWHQQHVMIFPGAHFQMPTAPAAVDAYSFPLKASDGVPLQAWVYPTAKSSDPIVLYFPGNYEQASWFIQNVAPILATKGVATATMNYRGFAGNPGVPSQEMLISDAKALLDALQSKHPQRSLVLVGRSLGSGVASQLYAYVQHGIQDLSPQIHLNVNARNAKLKTPLNTQEQRSTAHSSPVACLALITPFAKLAHPAQQRFFFLPASWIEALLEHPFDSKAALQSVSEHAPLYIVQAGKDKLIPAWSTQDLMNTAPSHLMHSVTLPDATHGNVMTGPLFWNGFLQFLDSRCLASSSTPSVQSQHPQSNMAYSSQERGLHERALTSRDLHQRKSTPANPRSQERTFSSKRPATAKNTSAKASWYFSEPLETQDLDSHFLWHINFLKEHSHIPTFILPEH